MRFVATCILILLFAFTGTALAQTAVATSDPSLSETARMVFDAVMHSNWWAAAAYGVVLAMIGARKLMPQSWKDGWKGDLIGTASVAVIAFAGAIGTWALAQASGAVMSWAVLAAAVKIAGAAIGGYTVIHKVAQALMAWGKLPAWATSVLKLLTMLVGSNAIKKAEEAGDKAVAADPPKGLASDSEVREVE